MLSSRLCCAFRAGAQAFNTNQGTEQDSGHPICNGMLLRKAALTALPEASVSLQSAGFLVFGELPIEANLAAQWDNPLTPRV